MYVATWVRLLLPALHEILLSFGFYYFIYPLFKSIYIDLVGPTTPLYSGLCAIWVKIVF
jgi:hypothetical protein